MACKRRPWGICPAIVLLLAGVGTGSLVRASELKLTKDGQPRAVIILAEAPSPAARKAAVVLQDHVKAVSGAELKVASEVAVQIDAKNRLALAGGPYEPDVFILVGQSSLAKKLGLGCEGLGPGGIAVETLPNAIALFGPDEQTPSDPWGTLYAVTVFLEDHIGCRYLWPGMATGGQDQFAGTARDQPPVGARLRTNRTFAFSSGKVIPRRPTITVGEIHHRYTPPIVQRRIRSLGYSDRLQVGLDRLGFTKDDYARLREEAMRVSVADPGWFQWHRLGGTMNLRSGHAFGHYWEKHGPKHPEWFAMQPNGSRDQTLAGNRARLCISNLELIEQIARDKIAELSADPGRTSVSLAPNDGGRLTFCMCDKCKQLDPPGGRTIGLLYDDASGERPQRRYFDYVSLTDRMAWFYNRIAERVTKVYPDALLVADAYSVYSAPPVREKLHRNIVIRFVPMTYLSDEGRRQALRDWDAWSQAAARIYFRPNFLNGARREGTLLVFAHKMADDLRYLGSSGLVGTDFDSCLHNWSTHGLNYYLLAKLLWDPEQDVDRLIDDYCRAGFGPAAGPVREYFTRIERLTDQIAATTDPGSLRGVDVTVPYTAEIISELGGLLDQAEKSAAEDEIILARIAFLRRGLDFTDLQAQAYRFLRQEGDVDREAAHRLLDRKYWLMRDIFEKSHLAVNVAYVAWGGGAHWRRLGWRWEGEHESPGGNQ